MTIKNFHFNVFQEAAERVNVQLRTASNQGRVQGKEGDRRQFQRFRFIALGEYNVFDKSRNGCGTFLCTPFVW